MEDTKKSPSPTAKVKEEEGLICSSCGNHGPFSNRQRKKAMMEESKATSARCTICIENDIESPNKKQGDDSKKKKTSGKDDKAHKAVVEAGTTTTSTTTTSTNTASNNNSSSRLLDQEIPRKKKTLSKKKAKSSHKKKEASRLEFSDGESVEDDQGSVTSGSSSSNSNGNAPMSVSIRELKQQILGRDVGNTTAEEVHHHDDDDQIIQQAKDPTDLVATNDTGDYKLISATNAASLNRDLTCVICHQVFYQPVSLPCGHSYCQECLDWWLLSQEQRNQGCPTCRQALRCAHSSLRVNLALRACVVTLFGDELVSRIQAKRQKTAGEGGGAHTKGYETMTPLTEEMWRSVQVQGGGGGGGVVKVRRSIVLDASDQRMQLALSVYQAPEKVVTPKDGFRVHICLITMEEDEACDGGFPVSIQTAEDEHFICTREDRFQLDTCLEVRMKTEAGTVVPISRLPLLSQTENGTVEFCLNEDAIHNYHEATSILFLHDETGAKLEIDLALMRKGASGGSFVPIEDRERNSYAYEEEEEDSHEEEEENELDYEDGFVVDDGEMEGEFSENDDEHDDDDFCCICRDGGDLMICDGGDALEGCGKSFHCACVDRQAIPQGDWVCSPCTNAAGGFQVEGNQGHEFPADITATDDVHESPTAAETANQKKRKIIGVLGDSSDEDEFDGDATNDLPRKTSSDAGQQSAKRRIIDDSDSDD